MKGTTINDDSGCIVAFMCIDTSSKCYWLFSCGLIGGMPYKSIESVTRNQSPLDRTVAIASKRKRNNRNFVSPAPAAMSANSAPRAKGSESTPTEK